MDSPELQRAIEEVKRAADDIRQRPLDWIAELPHPIVRVRDHGAKGLRHPCAFAVRQFVDPNSGQSVYDAARSTQDIAAAWLGRKQLTEETAQSRLLRDIFGNPFRPVTISNAWLTWRDATIPKLAQSAYDERELPSGHLDAKRLVILADALEESGCTNEDVLAHLRGSGPRVLGGRFAAGQGVAHLPVQYGGRP